MVFLAPLKIVSGQRAKAAQVSNLRKSDHGASNAVVQSARPAAGR